MLNGLQENGPNGHEFVQLVAEELNISLEKAGRITRAVFHALRNHISHEESFQLLGQLPLALKGVYVDGWKFNKDFNVIEPVIDFLDEVKKEEGILAKYDFKDIANVQSAIIAVFKALNYLVSESDMNNIINAIPGELRQNIRERIAGNQIVF